MTTEHPNKMERSILCLRRDDVELLLGNRSDKPGFHAGQQEELFELLKTRAVWHRRALAEEDSSFKQIIPYTIVVHDAKILTYLRGESGDEQRLHAKMSVGFGGHIELRPEWVQSFKPESLFDEATRELQEELVMDEYPEPVCIGIINDESDSVGSVHIGLVFLVEAVNNMVIAGEDSQKEIVFRDLLDIDTSVCEGWTALLVEALRSPEFYPGMESTRSSVEDFA